MDLKMGVCVSQDGINFGRVEGDEADGSLLGPDNKSWERRNAPVAWPAVCAHPDGSGDLVLFYGATDDASGKPAVGVAAPRGSSQDESRRRRDRDVAIPWRRVAATPRRGYSVGTRRVDAATAT